MEGYTVVDDKQSRDYITIQDVDGIQYNIRRDHFKNGIKPSVQTAVSKNDWLILRLKKLFGDDYDYSKINYIRSVTPVELVCSEHGVFKRSPNSLLTSKKGCPKCSSKNAGKTNRIKTEEFINRASKTHNNEYDYSKVECNGQYDTVKIICKVHGQFNQIVKNHLRGSGCYECSKLKISKSRTENPTGWTLSDWIKTSETSSEFDSFKLYVLRFYNGEEEFIKIGRTFKKINRRFLKSVRRLYSYDELLIIQESPSLIYNTEFIIKREYRDYSYIPNKSFHGMYECFDINQKDNILGSIESYLKDVKE